MPFLINQKTEEEKTKYLINLYNEIYFKDIKERYEIKNDEELNELLNFLASNIGSLTNPNKLINTFNSIKKINISKYY